jgi:hypothetical protein
VRDPLAALPRWIVAHALRVAALEVRDPVARVVLVKRHDFARDWHYASAGARCYYRTRRCLLKVARAGVCRCSFLIWWEGSARKSQRHTGELRPVPLIRVVTARDALVRGFSFADCVIALAVDVGSLLHGFALRAAVFSGTHGTRTNRMRALGVVSDRHLFPPAALLIALALHASIALRGGGSTTGDAVFRGRMCLRLGHTENISMPLSAL